MLPNKVILFIASLTLLAMPGLGRSVEERVACPEDYSPCTCDLSVSGATSVICDQIPLATVQDVFGRTSPKDLSSLRLTLSPIETSSIPADLLGDSRTNGLTINCITSSHNLVIDDKAFRATESLTKTVLITGCDLSRQPNFRFLSGFETLASLSIYNSKNFNSFQGLPSQSSLYYIAILNSVGFQNLDDTLVGLPGLRILYLYNDQLDDPTAAKILNSLARNSTASLEELRLYNNKLTRVPRIVSSFSKLNQLMMEYNIIDVIDTRSLAFFGPLSYLQLANNGITTIEPSSFGGGTFGSVYLHQNKLSRFESYVFQVMLEGIILSGQGILSLYENPIECDCHLAWLIYYKRELLPVINGGQCANSTLFTELNPVAFSDCPVFTCPAGVDGYYPNPLSCTSYYACTAGVASLTACPSNLVFNPAYQVCDYSFNVPTCNVRHGLTIQ